MNKHLFLRHQNAVLLAFISITAVFLRMHNLNQSLWFDEVWYATRCAVGTMQQVISFALFDKSAPFYYIFMFFWTKIFGDSEISVRIPSFICGILSIPLCYSVASRLFNKRTAILTACLLCISPVHIWYSQEATPYAIILLLLLVSIYSYYRIEEEGLKKFWLAVYFFSLLLAVFSHWYAFSYLAAISVICLARRKKATDIILLLNFLIFLALLIFILIKIKFGILQSIKFARKPFLRPFTPFEMWLLFFNWFSFSNSLWSIQTLKPSIRMILQRPYLLLFQVMFFLIFMRGIIAILKERKNYYRLDILLYIFLPPLGVLVASKFVYPLIYIERYLFIVLPFFITLLVKGAVSFKRRVLKIVSLMLLFLFGFASLTGYFIQSDEWTVFRVVPDWKSAANYFRIENQVTKGHVIISGASPAICYYRLHFSNIGSGSIHYSDYEQLADVLRNPSARKLYLIEEKGFKTEEFEDTLAFLMNNPRISLVGRHHFKGMEIYKFQIF